VGREKEQAMENYDRQQDGGNFGEAKEDVLPIRSTARQFRRTPGTATGGEGYSNFLQEKLS
jgi:hypothetical protein